MGKSRAEIQKAYRERKKAQEGSSFLKNERKRTKKYYTPISERSESSKKTRRQRVRQYVRDHRIKKRLEVNNSEPENVNGTETAAVNDTNESDENGVSSSTSGNILKIKLPSFDPKNRTRKRMARAAAKNHQEIKKLKLENESLKRQVKTISKRCERLKKKNKNNNVIETPKRKSKPRKQVTDEPEASLIYEQQSTDLTPRNRATTETDAMSETEQYNSDLTPRKRVAAEIAELGLTPSKVPKKIRDTMLFANVVTEEIKSARETNGQKGRKIIGRLLSGKLIKKYIMSSKMNKLTGIQRRNMATTKRCDIVPQIRKRVKEREVTQKSVHEFLMRDDNSRVMPGKNDKVRKGAHLKQKRVLNDCMKFLHLKYKTETERNISFATFCRMRPKSISLTRYITKNQCLRQKHQNMALTLKALKAAGVHVPLNPDEFIRRTEQISESEFVKDLPESIHHQQWQKVTMDDGKKRTKVVGKDLNKAEFQKIVLDQTAEFKGHVSRIKTQYKVMMNLKENIGEEHAIIQMDFAENFSCTSTDEVQSAYWNSNAPYTL